MFPGATADGVFAMWWRKVRVSTGPATSQAWELRRLVKHGGVLLLAGDDHAANRPRRRIRRNTPSWMR